MTSGGRESRRGEVAGHELVAASWTFQPGAVPARDFMEHRAGAPPKWMFRNITAIRENTDRILELLESGRPRPAPPVPPPDH